MTKRELEIQIFAELQQGPAMLEALIAKFPPKGFLDELLWTYRFAWALDELDRKGLTDYVVLSAGDKFGDTRRMYFLKPFAHWRQLHP